jgi:hypothetical protein
MAWYKTGTITVTNGSTTVTGSGTQWIANAGVGEALYAPDGKLYEITNIASDTTMTIAPAYLGTTASAQPYVLVPSQSYIRDLAAQAADLVNNYSTIANNAGVGKFGDGTLAAPGIRFSDDLDTGFFRSASNEVTFVAGGVAQFKYNASGLSISSGTANVTNLAYTGTLTGGTGVVNIGSGQVYKDASGNVGIGTSSPGNKLTIQGASFVGSSFNGIGIQDPDAERIRFGYNDGTPQTGLVAAQISANATVMQIVSRDVSNGALSFHTGSGVSEKMRLDSAGNVGIGTSSPLDKFEVVGSMSSADAKRQRIRMRMDSDVARLDATFYSGASGGYTPLAFSTGDTERMRIDSSGNLLVGTTGLLSGMTGQFAVGFSRQIAIDTTVGSIYIRGNASPYSMGTEFIGSSGTYRGGFGVLGSSDSLTYYWVGTAYNGTGVQLNYGGTSWATLSDEREKNIYGVIENALDKVLQFDGVYFNYKSDKPEQRRRVGFSAQKVQAVFPEAVDESQREIDNPTEETKRLTLSATEIIPLLVQAVKEQQALIQDLTTRLTTLEGN